MINEFISSKIKLIKSKTQSDYSVVCLSSKENFRKKMFPQYKSNRTALKPLAYRYAREYMKNKFCCFERTGLEADDLIGIIATFNGKLKNIPQGEKVIWSCDKDFKTIPSVFFRETENGCVKEIVTSEIQADYNWMLQTLTGDSADGYSGCPNIGIVKAKKILGSIQDFDLCTAWQNVVHAYEKQGKSEADAVIQARCARILRAADYDFKTKEIKLWEKPVLSEQIKAKE